MFPAAEILIVFLGVFRPCPADSAPSPSALLPEMLADCGPAT